MRAPKPGDILAYSYLWWREHEAGEESGRKIRPVVVVVAVDRKQDGLRVVVVPVTHSAPGARAAVEVPAAIKLAVKLDGVRSWVICDEANAFTWPGPDLGRTNFGEVYFGALPPGLTARVREAVLDAIKRGVLRTAGRDEA